MSFDYTINIPFASNNPSVDQPSMEQNTNSISNLVSVDHVGFNNSTAGQHKQVTFAQISSPSTPGNPVSILYTKNDVSGNPQLNFINSAAFANTVGGNGAVLLFGGVILQWGFASLTGSSMNFPVAFPNNAYSMTVTGTSALYTGGFVVTALSATAFTVTRTSGTGATGYYYIAIGN